VGRFQHVVTLRINDAAFLLRMRSPQQKNHALTVRIDGINHPVSKRLPAKPRVRVCFARLNGQYRIQQHYPLRGPALQKTVLRALKAVDILFKLFIHIKQRGRDGHARQHRKSQAVRLILSVIGILTQNHHLDIAQFCQFKRVKHIFLWRINGHARGPLLRNRLQRLFEIGFLFLICQHVVPDQLVTHG